MYSWLQKSGMMFAFCQTTFCLTTHRPSTGSKLKCSGGVSNAQDSKIDVAIHNRYGCEYTSTNVWSEEKLHQVDKIYIWNNVSVFFLNSKVIKMTHKSKIQVYVVKNISILNIDNQTGSKLFLNSSSYCKAGKHSVHSMTSIQTDDSAVYCSWHALVYFCECVFVKEAPSHGDVLQLIELCLSGRVYCGIRPARWQTESLRLVTTIWLVVTIVHS